jgi:hypothetical protein
MKNHANTEEAAHSLHLNGVFFNEAFIGVHPSSCMVLDRAHNILDPFPQTYQADPDGWICPQCGVGNVREHDTCRKCFRERGPHVLLSDKRFNGSNNGGRGRGGYGEQGG